MEGRTLGLRGLLKPFLIYTKTFLGELKASRIWKSYSWDRRNSRSQSHIVIDMEIELRGCFWMFPQTQSQCVAMLGLESRALSRLLQGHTLV